ncbi:MAG: type II secretion system F family protein [Patescibacteria group bacterium]
MKFKYRALKGEKTVSGKIEANNVDEAVTLLKAGGFFPIDIKRDTGDSSSFKKLLDRVNFTDIVNFTRQLSIMLNAGITLIDAFDIFKKQTPKESFLHLIEEMDRDIRSGISFSNTLKKHPEYFSRLYVSLVKAGEASGKLNDILLSLATNLEKQRELRGKLKGAMIYPALIIAGMFIVIFIMITFVIPELLSLYTDLDADLPMSTVIINQVSTFSSENWPFILIVLGVVGFLIYNYVRTPEGKANIDKLVLKVPILKDVLIQSLLVDTTRAFSILVGSGVSILDALEIAREASGNVEFQKAFRRISIKVEKGVSLGNAMREEPLFPPLIVQMAVVGERTGHLDETMGKISRYFEVESEIAIKSLTTLIEPAILVILGVTIGFIIFSVITPIYSLTSQF